MREEEHSYWDVVSRGIMEVFKTIQFFRLEGISNPFLSSSVISRVDRKKVERRFLQREERKERILLSMCDFVIRKEK